MSQVAKYYYFGSIRGRGELPKLVLAYAGAKYDFVGIPREEWYKTKGKPGSHSVKAPFGQLPYYEDDVVGTMGESISIGFYLAEKYGLLGDTPRIKAQANALVERCRDIQNICVKVCFDPDFPKVKDTVNSPESKNNIIVNLQNLEKLVTDKASVLVGEKITIADLQAFDTLNNWVFPLWPEHMKSFPGLTRVCNNVATTPKIKAYLESSICPKQTTPNAAKALCTEKEMVTLPSNAE
mmetsp:Transcript_9364/g.10361  ORF Transcript_9364/g.10361 Transcript_9364/m.10361 type:complete len:238 (+) Transcript_9364:22-735(+)